MKVKIKLALFLLAAYCKAMSVISVSEVRGKKAELDAVLRQAIVAFQMETGVLVDRIDVQQIDTTTCSDHGRSALTDVRARLRWDD